MIAAARGFVLVGQATSGEEAVRAVDRLSPQLVLMDVRMPGMDGIEATRAILERHPGVVVVLISVDDPTLFPGATSLGDAGLLHPQARPRSGPAEAAVGNAVRLRQPVQRCFGLPAW